MDTTPSVDDRTRRRVLLAVAAGTVPLAGCLAGDSGDETDDEIGDENGTDSEGDDSGTDSGDDENGTDSGAGGDGSGDGGPQDVADTAAAAVPVRGDPEADVVLEVYEDLGCPHCRNYTENGFPELEAQYIEDGQIRYEHRDFVVTGIDAERAASAAREALARHGIDAFWSYTSAVFANQGRIGEGADLFAELARDLSLDADAIAAAGAERAHQSVVERDEARGLEFGVSATPSFVVDGELVDTSGARSMSDVVDAVSDALDAALAGGDDGDSSPYY